MSAASYESIVHVFSPPPFLWATHGPSSNDPALPILHEEETKKKERESKEIVSEKSSDSSYLTDPSMIVARTHTAARISMYSHKMPSVSNECVSIHVLLYSLSTANLRYNSDLMKICNYIQRYRPYYREQCQNTRKNLFIPASKNHDRSLQFNLDGSVFIHFNRKKKGDLCIGRTAMKGICLAINFDNGAFVASARISNHALIGLINLTAVGTQIEKLGELELRGMQLTKNIRGFIKGFYPVAYQSKKGLDKVRVILPLYSSGNLHANRYHLTLEQRFDIAVQLLTYLVSLHASGLIHRDLKETNVFLERIGGKCEVVIGDSNSICIHEEVLTKLHKTTTHYASPEYAKAIINNKCLSNVTNEKLDIWSMGCVLFSLFYPASSRDLPGRNCKDNAAIVAQIAALPEDWLPLTLHEKTKKTSMDVLISHMLQVNPKKRIGPEELAKEVHALTPS